MDQELLLSIWDALKQPVPSRRNRIGNANAITIQIANAGIANESDIEDIAEAFDSRLYGLDMWRIADFLEIPRRSYFPKPRFVNATIGGGEAISAIDAAAILVFLEQLGFLVDPTALLEIILPIVNEKRYLTGCEIDLFRYPKQKGRHCIELSVSSDHWGIGLCTEEKRRTPNGGRIRAILREGRPLSLTITGPRFKRRPEPQSYQCEYCGMRYLRGDPEDNLSHRSYHARIKRVLDPTPKRQFLEELNSQAYPELVTAGSPMWKHQEMYERAKQFRREMGFDFVQWGRGTARDTDPDVHGFLFSDITRTFPNGTIVGACAFRRREEQWSLEWIWLAPKVRHKGILTNRWPSFLDRFGDFSLAHPLSDAMKAFVLRNGTEAQKAGLQGYRNGSETISSR